MSDKAGFAFGGSGSIRDYLDQATARAEARQAETSPLLEMPPEEDDSGIDPLPTAGDPYRAYGRPSNKRLEMVCFLFKGVGFKILSYGNLESIDLLPPASAGQSPELLLLFAGINPVTVHIEGKNLVPLADYLRQHRLAWIRECPAGQEFRESSGTVVRRMQAERLAE